MQLILLIISAVLLVKFAETSPLSVLSDWRNGELWRLTAVFAVLVAVWSVLRKFNTRNIVSVLLALPLLLIFFGVAPTIAVFLMTVTAAALGVWVMERCKIGNSSLDGYDLVIGISIGYAILAGVLQIAVHFPVNNYEIYVLGLTILVSILFGQILRIWKCIICYLNRPFSLSAIEFVVPIGATLVGLTFVSYPETHSDALMVNLNIANQLNNHGVWSFNTINEVWALWPKAAAWIHSAAYIVGDSEKAARLSNFSFIILTAILLCKSAEKFGLGRHSWMLYSLYISSPITLWCSFVIFDDAVFAFFTLALILFLAFSQRVLSPTKLFIISLLCSACIITKITGLFLLPVIGLIVVLQLFRARSLAGLGLSFRARNLFHCCLALSPFIVIAAIPYVYSYAITGNPVFPLYNDIFKSDGFALTRFEDGRWNAPLGLGAAYEITANTAKFNEGRHWTFGIHIGLFLLTTLYAIWANRKNFKVLMLASSILCFLCLVFSQIHYARYLFPISSLICLFVVLSFDQMSKSRILGKSVSLIVLCCVLVNMLNVKSLNMYYSFNFSTFSQSPANSFADYYEKSLNEYVNIEYGSAAIVLYVHRPYSANLDGTALKYHWTSPLIKSDVDAIKNIYDLKAVINKYHITHVIWDSELFSSTPLAIYELIPQVAEKQRKSGSAELWKIGLLPITQNQIIKMGDKQNANILGHGWWAQEAWGTWTNAESSTLQLRVVPSLIADFLRVNFSVMPYAPAERKDALKVDVYANNTIVGSFSLSPVQQFSKLELDIPKSVFQDENLNIELKFSKAFDGTNFQLGFSEITFEYN